MHPRRKYNGRFFGRRVNCERVPLLPAGVVRMVLSDPRKIPYLLVWRSERDGEVKEAVRLARYSEPGPWDWTGWVEFNRTYGTHTLVRTQQRALPRNGGAALLLICPGCREPCRGLYGWVPGGQYTTSVQRSHWQCRACAELRYASEGGALLIRSRGILGRLFGVGRSNRPDPWYPYFFTSPEDVAAAGFCK